MSKAEYELDSSGGLMHVSAALTVSRDSHALMFRICFRSFKLL